MSLRLCLRLKQETHTNSLNSKSDIDTCFYSGKKDLELWNVLCTLIFCLVYITERYMLRCFNPLPSPFPLPYKLFFPAAIHSLLRNRSKKILE